MKAILLLCLLLAVSAQARPKMPNATKIVNNIKSLKPKPIVFKEFNTTVDIFHNTETKIGSYNTTITKCEPSSLKAKHSNIQICFDVYGCPMKCSFEPNQSIAKNCSMSLVAMTQEFYMYKMAVILLSFAVMVIIFCYGVCYNDANRHDTTKEA